MKVLIFIIILIILQFLAYNFVRVLMWQLNIHQQRARKWLMIGVFVLTDGMLLLHAFRLITIFRLTASWMVVLWFAFLTTAAVVILAKILRRTPLYQQDALKLNQHLRLIAPVIFVGILSLAVYNAYVPVVKRVSIQIDKPMAMPVRIGMVADTHLGRLVGARQLDKLANILQAEQVDMVLIPGDVMDDDTVAYDAENMKPHLQKIRAPLGVYATLGNHDLFGHQQEITQAIRDAGITVLHDDVVKVDNRFWLVGRPDPLDKNRLATTDLLKRVNVAEPVFLLDHRPDDVSAHAQLPIDLQVSGHVHNGQVFPINLFVRAINRIHYGYEQIQNSHFVVTSGFGFWGVPFRLASQSEVWIIDVKGK